MKYYTCKDLCDILNVTGFRNRDDVSVHIQRSSDGAMLIFRGQFAVLDMNTKPKLVLIVE